MALRPALRPDRRGDRSAHAPGGHVNRALDVALAGTGPRPRESAARAGGARDQLEDGGPVLYRQRRVGKDGADFEILKLRSMVVGAETKGAGLAVDAGDARITRVGRIVRRTSIDELPQLWNVVRGEMSVIGPRPTVRAQVDRYTERQRRRLEVKPGLDRLGAGARSRDAAVGRADRAGRLVRRSPLACRRPEDPAPHPARAVRRHLQGRDGRLEGAWSNLAMPL